MQGVGVTVEGLGFKVGGLGTAVPILLGPVRLGVLLSDSGPK